MGILDRLLSIFKDKPAPSQGAQLSGTASAVPIPEAKAVDLSNNYLRLGLLHQVSVEEKELVSVITTAVMAGDSPNTQFKVKEVYGIDTDKEIAAIVAAATMAGDNPNSSFRLNSIVEIA